jgi:Zn-dependent metalloprotease
MKKAAKLYTQKIANVKIDEVTDQVNSHIHYIFRYENGIYVG